MGSATTYAVMAKGQKESHQGSLDTQFEADAYLEGFKSTSALNPKDLTIETRKGERVRGVVATVQCHIYAIKYEGKSEKNDYRH